MVGFSANLVDLTCIACLSCVLLFLAFLVFVVILVFLRHSLYSWYSFFPGILFIPGIPFVLGISRILCILFLIIITRYENYVKIYYNVLSIQILLIIIGYFACLRMCLSTNGVKVEEEEDSGDN